MKFEAHGHYKIHVESNVLHIDGKGPFNKELVTEYTEALETCVAELESQGAWYQLVVLYQLCLMTPDSESVFVKSLKERKSRGLMACAVVLSNPQGQSLITEQFGKAYLASGVEHQFFNDVEQAMAWLNAIRQ
ncbi:hypothetical protein GCM10011369_09720 [Neiella marina]|uniref:Uncharacterized protein n=1 Tax=Neiella marina TaxID=508461 RepID=A0A8J2U356_9GAMM|nr:hypothetical protein [Neiella marina]GGA70090.1 hypothetical protein GCM10011369_09720 [Neiella marina]